MIDIVTTIYLTLSICFSIRLLYIYVEEEDFLVLDLILSIIFFPGVIFYYTVFLIFIMTLKLIKAIKDTKIGKFLGKKFI